MNNITGFILSFFILISNLGLAVNIHYCHDRVASVTLGYPESDSCNDDQGTCCAKEDNHKKCCSETTIKAEKKSDNFVVKSISFDAQQFWNTTLYRPRPFSIAIFFLPPKRQ